jgi:hypothetical protein
MLDDIPAAVTSLDGTYSGFKTIVETWKSNEDVFKITVLASAGTAAIGLVGTIAGIVFPRTLLLDILYTIWKFVVALQLLSFGAATFVQAEIMTNRMELHNLVYATP